MKKLLTIIPSLLLLSALNGNAQVFWTESFETGATTGLEVSSYSGPNGAWTLSVTGSEGTEPNRWYVSCQEAGQLAGVCGSTCTSSFGLGATLHVGSDPGLIGDNGASYDAGGLCGLLACPQTDRRAQSPTINCTGKYNIRLKFYYILNGQGTTDDGSVYYSPDNGATWSLLMTPAKTTTCTSGQGRWDSTSINLPSSANNNPNVKIGFRWVNNDDGAGTDPSFAVDSVSLRTPATTVIDASMTASATTACEDSCITFTNTSTGTVDSFKFSCPGATIATATTSPASICFPNSGNQTVKIYLYSGGVKVDSASTAVSITPSPRPTITLTGSTLSVPALYTAYQWYNGLTPIAGATSSSYTYATMGAFGIIVDSAGCRGVSIYNPLSVTNINGTATEYKIAQTNSSSLILVANLPVTGNMNVTILDATGKLITTDTWTKGQSTLQINGITTPAGMYIIRISNDHTVAVIRWMKQ